jgi:mannose-1-phosphate guanylyltransferase/very-short-patch-repair endonuclease
MKKREAPASTGISYLVKKRRFMYTPENTYVAIMAGGVGSRFWPASREAMPKQFLDILGVGKSLLQLTFDRFRPLCPVANIYIVTNAAYRDLVLEQLPDIQPAQILAEPSRNNTAPCVAYTALKLHALNPNANLVVAPSDHIILQEDTFLDDLRYALEFTSSHDALLTLGIQPTRPDTGYGYIQYDSSPLLRRGAGGEANLRIPEKFPYETAQPLDTEAGLPLTPSKGGGTDHPQTEETDSSPLLRRGAGGEASPQIPEKFPYETAQPLDTEAGLPLTPSEGGGTDHPQPEETNSSPLLRRGAGGEASPQIPEKFPYETANPRAYKFLKKMAALQKENPTEAETYLWEKIRNKKLGGYKFRRQHIIDRFIADFICLDKKFIIEVDGKIHQLPDVKFRDEERTAILNEFGFEVLRLSNEQILKGGDALLERLKRTLDSSGLPLTPSKGGGTDHPQPEETNSSPLLRRGAGGEASPQIPEKFPYETAQPLDTEAGLPLTPSKGGGTDQSVSGAGGEAHKVLRFTEKPPLDKAREFLAAGNYLWNAGIFIWSTESLLAAFRDHAAGIYDILAKGMPYYNTSGEQVFIDQAYPETPNISIDYAILEKADNVYTIPTAFGWSDLGTWASLHAEAPKTDHHNALNADPALLFDVHNSLIRAPKNKLVVIKDLNNFIVVDEGDVLLIWPKDQEQEIKAITAQIKAMDLGKLL